jgi:hypothetical protein
MEGAVFLLSGVPSGSRAQVGDVGFVRDGHFIRLFIVLAPESVPHYTHGFQSLQPRTSNHRELRSIDMQKLSFSAIRSLSC